MMTLKELATETHFLFALDMRSRIHIAALFVILPYKQYFIQ